MQNRVLSLFLIGAAFATGALHAQAPDAPPPGLVIVAQVRGSAHKTWNEQVTALKVNDAIEQSAKINTGRDSSVVLVFSNGATTQLGEDTELVLDEFLQDPFASTVKVAELEEEPSRSRTRLSLNRGELVGKVTKLKHDRGSSFTVQTPVGAAGIRGTTFRIVFRPQGTGLAFFQLSTVEGNVNFSQGTQTPGSGGPTVGPTQDQGALFTQPPSTAGDLPVIGGQEVVIEVTVNITSTGQVVVSAPPQIVSATVPISAAAQTQIIAQAQNIAVAVATTTFTPPPPAPPPTPGGEGSSPPGSQTPSGSTGPGTSGPPTDNSPQTAPPNTPTTPPPPVISAPKLTPGDGQSSG